MSRINTERQSCYTCYKFPNCLALRDYKTENGLDREEYIDGIGEICGDYRRFNSN